LALTTTDTNPATASTDVDEIAVIARVADVAAWEALGEVRVGARIGAPLQEAIRKHGRI